MEIGHGLDAVFRPRSIAVIGASQDVTKIGGRPLQLLQKYGFEGPIYPVNKSGGTVQSLAAFTSVRDVPGPVDLAIIAVPAGAAVEAAQECAATGVKAVVILSAGFAEVGAEGTQMQRRLIDIAAQSGMRILGPNCLGSIGIATRSIATFSIMIEEVLPASGPVGIVSQSGNLGSFTMRMASQRGVGISNFMATGNECDVDISDGIAWMARDPATKVILCCLETCRSGTKFQAALQMARQAGKPVVVLKIGSSEAGSAAAASHTGALAGSDAVFDVVFRNAGAVRVSSIEQLIDMAHALSVVGKDRLPKGDRVALVAASGGFGVMMADSASRNGLSLPRLGKETQERILQIVPYAAPYNPVDTTAQVSSRPELFRDVLSAVAVDPVCDTVIVLMSSSLFVPRLRAIYLEALAGLRRAHPDKLVVLCCSGPADTIAQINDMGFATIQGIDAVCAAVGALVRLGASRDAANGQPAVEKVRNDLPASAFSGENEAKKVLAQAGIAILEERVVSDKAKLLTAAAEIGYPVVIKIVSADIAHKTEVGGVVVGLQNADELAQAYDTMLANVGKTAPEARIDGVLVVKMAGTGTELILGTKNDTIFGPVVMVGLGGIFAEVMQDVALQIAPVTEATALSMIRSLKAFPILDGARGRARADINAAASAIAALSRLAVAQAGVIGEIDINPLLVSREGEGAVALDALFVPVEPAEH